MVKHHFTVDVEEYFHSSALEGIIPRSNWDRIERRAEPLVRRLLDRLDAHEARGTFFVLGWLAEKEFQLVKEIARRGHEIASHGWGHERVTSLSREAFRESVRRTKRYLEDLGGCAVLGYRAPSFSIVPGREWALDVLMEEGYRYDSSLFPIKQHASYGYPDGERDPYWIKRPSGRIAEVPPATFRVLGTNLPAAGGAYFRLFPYGLLRGALRQAGARKQPGTFYIHPWELDADVRDDYPLNSRTRLRLFGGRRRVWPRLEKMLGEFRFCAVRDTIADMEQAIPVRQRG